MREGARMCDERRGFWPAPCLLHLPQLDELNETNMKRDKENKKYVYVYTYVVVNIYPYVHYFIYSN